MSQRQINLSLAVTADTSAAKTQLQSLQQQLNNLTTGAVKATSLPITPALHEAQGAVASLQVALNSAMNVNTGKLDLSKFNQSLNQAGLTAEKLRIQLQQFGPEGSRAFMTLAQSVMQAEVPMRRSSALLTQLGTTLKNTVKWQISSTLLHGFMSSVQTAYRYSQDLNESLNNIRIVTRKGVEEMDAFAESANKAAKALSASTLDYTNAALIYYQQGLDKEAVEERTKVTLKMANVLGESAKDVSSYMTAIWNNFDDGTKSLEYYGDAMAALGAATASSSAEIAGGLEKFASIGETVGLSFEYATAALATVVAKTRQSEDTVGTAFKTIFARLQGLSLGETLEDGTSLNKYSEALAAVGVNIKDASGDLKDMNIIIDELGVKWKALAQDEKTALAQTVAGTRQYAQLISLLDNYDDFKDNVNVALKSSGTLQKQQDIYAESWEAASKRVKAAAQQIYSSIMDDKFFIGILDGFEKFLTLIDKVMDSMGGLKGVLSGLSVILLKTFSAQAAKGIENMAYNMKMMTAYGSKQVTNIKTDYYNQATKVSNSGYVSASQEVETTVMKNQLGLQRQLQLNAENLTKEEIEKYQLILDQNKAYADQYIQLEKNREKIEDEKNALSRQALTEAGVGGYSNVRHRLANANTQVDQSVKAQSELNKIFKENSANAENLHKELSKLTASSGNVFGNMKEHLEKVNGEFSKSSPDQYISKIREIVSNGDLLNIGLIEAQTQLQGEGKEFSITAKTAGELINKIFELNKRTNEAAAGEENYKAKLKLTQQQFVEMQSSARVYGQTLVGIAQGISTLAFGLSAFTGVIDTLKDPDTSGWEKFLRIAMSLTMVLPALTTVIKLLNIEAWKNFGIQTKDVIIKTASVLATMAETKAERINARAKRDSANAKRDSAAAAGVEAVADTVEKAATDASTKAELRNQAVKRGKKTGTSLKATKNTGTPMKYKAVLKGGGGAAASGGAQAAAAGGSTGGATTASLASSLGTIASSILPVAIAIAAIAATITIVYKRYNKLNEEAEKANKVAEEAKKQYEEVKAAYEEFNTTISNYQSSRDSLKSLKKGTVEYTEALFKANEAAKELLRTNKDLKYTVVDGEIIIDKDSLEDVRRKELEKMTTASNSADLLQKKADEATLKADRQKFNRDKVKNSGGWDSTTAGNVATGAGGGAIAGAAIGTMITPVIGTAIGAVAGAVIGAVGAGIASEVSGDSTSEEERALDLLAKQYKKNGEAVFASPEAIKNALRAEGITDPKLIESLSKNSKETEKLVKRIADQNAATKANTAMIAATLNQGNDNVTNSDYEEAINYKEAEKYEKYETSVYDNYLNLAKSRVGTVRHEDSVSAFEEYAEIMGLSDLDQFKATNYKTDGTIKYKYLDENGDWQKKSVSAETIAATLASNAAKEKYGETSAETVRDYEEEFNKIRDSLLNAGLFNDSTTLSAEDIVNQWIMGDGEFDLSKLTEEEIKALEDGIVNANIDESMKGALDRAIDNWEPPSAEDIAELTAKDFEFLNSLKTGDTIDEEKYNQLSSEFQSYFDKQIDGTYKLVGIAEEIKNKAFKEKLQEARDDYLKAKDDFMNNDPKAIQDQIDSTNLQIEQLKFQKGNLEAANAAPEESFSSNDKKIVSDANVVDAAYFGLKKGYIDSGDSVYVSADQNSNKRYFGNANLSSMYATLNGIKSGSTMYGGSNILEGQTIEGIDLEKLRSSLAASVIVQSGAGSNRYDFDIEEFANAYGLSDTVAAENLLNSLVDNSSGGFFAGYTNFLSKDLNGTEENFDNLSHEAALVWDNHDKTDEINYIDRQIESYESQLEGLEGIQSNVTDFETYAENYANASLERNDLLLLKEASPDLYNKKIQAVQQRDAEFSGLDIEEIEEYSDYLKSINPSLKQNSELSREIAINQSKMSKGAEELTSNWQDWNEVLNTSSVNSSEYSKVVSDLSNSLGNLFDIDSSELKADFFTDDVKNTINNIVNSGGSDLDAIYELRTDIINYLNKDGLIDNSLISKITTVMAQYKDAKAGDIIDLGAGIINQINSLNAEQQSAILNMLEAYGLIAEVDESGKITNFISSGIDSLQTKLKDYQSQKEKKDLKVLDEEIERYYTISRQLDKISKQQEKLSTIKDRAYGAKKVKAIEEETKALEKQIEAQDEYLRQIKERAASDKGAVEYFGAQFDENGVITNYDQIFQEQLNAYNAVVSAYNNSSQTEKDKTMLEAAEKRFELFQNSLSQYEETVNLLDEETTKKIEMENQLIDKALEKIQTTVTLKLEIEDMALERLQYFLEKLDDPMIDATDAMSNLGKQVESVIAKSEAAQKGIDEIIAGAQGRELTADEIEQLKTYREQLYENNKTLIELENNVKEKVLESFNAWNEEMEKSSEKLDILNSTLETYSNIIDMVGEKTLGLNSKMIIDLARSKVEVAKGTLTTAFDQLQTNQKALEEAKQGLAKATTDDEKETFQELIETIEDNIQTLQSDVESAWTDALQTAADAFKTQVEQITKILSNNLAGAFGSLEDLSTFYDRQKEIGDLYLDDYKKVYELNKLNRQLEKDIDNTDNLKAKRELAKLQEEINDMMQSEQDVSEQDLAYLQKRYDLKLAEIALEEAQNAKSQVRMTRDSEGNWSYTYTADESKTADAEQNYEDKMYALQDYATSQLETLQSNYVQLTQKMTEELAQIDTTTEEGMVKAQEIKDHYIAIIEANILEQEKLLAENALMNQQYNAGLAQDFSDTLFSKIYPDYTTFNEVKSDIDFEIQQSLENLASAYQTWQENVEQVFSIIGETVTNFGTVTMPNLYTNTKKETENIVKASITMKTNMNKEFKGVVDYLSTWYTAYKKKTDDTVKENEDIAKSVENLITDYADLDKQKDIQINVASPGLAELDSDLKSINDLIDKINGKTVSVKTDPVPTVYGVRLGDYGGNFGQSGTLDLFNSKGQKSYTGQRWYFPSYGFENSTIVGYKDINGERLFKLDEPVYVAASNGPGAVGFETYWLSAKDLDSYGVDVNRIDLGQLQSLDTGGYTGVWGSEGRLAMLHEKELILDPQDTENFLSAVGIVREISKIIDLNAQAASFGLGNVNTSTVNNPTQEIEQNITIHAEFPDATNHSEIEEAFNNLINSASQYVNRKNF